MSDTTVPTNSSHQRAGTTLPPPPPPPPPSTSPFPQMSSQPAPAPQRSGTVSVDSSSYVVTTPAAEVSPGEDRRGEFSVSITNVTGRPLRTALRLEPTAPALPEWFTVLGGAEREFALGETESFTVQVQVPPTVPAGTYSVRCDAIAEAQPQEVFTLGPTVAIAVPAPPKKKPFPKWILAAIAAIVLLAIIITVVVAVGGDDETPDVTGVPGTAAIAALNDAGFDTNPPVAAVNPCDAPVASQETDGDTVDLTFEPCGRLIGVNNFVGRNASQIVPLLNNPAFRIEVVELGEAAACNPQVVAQVPPPGTRTNQGHVLLLAIPAEPDGCNIVNQLPPADDNRLAFFEN